MLNKCYVLHLGIMLSLSCTPNEQESAISKEADDYLNEVLELMETSSINRDTIDWPEFRNTVFEKADSAQTIEDTYPAIKVALTLLGDNHSMFRKPEGTILTGSRKIKCEVESIPAVQVPEAIGYIKIGSFSGSAEKAVAFAENIQNQIQSADSPDLAGWIVDLRGNTGGNMWPMLAGVGPILGEGTIGYFVNAKDQWFEWEYQDGSSLNSDQSIIEVERPYQLINPNPKVALLLDNGIMSSGEATAIAFIGRENTRSFGSPTCGLSTANSTIDLSDGAQLILTVAYMTDRNQKVYGMPVEPDEVADPEEVVQRAVEWLQTAGS